MYKVTVNIQFFVKDYTVFCSNLAFRFFAEFPAGLSSDSTVFAVLTPNQFPNQTLLLRCLYRLGNRGGKSGQSCNIRRNDQLGRFTVSCLLESFQAADGKNFL